MSHGERKRLQVGENMLVIHPDECIDCGVYEPECPAQAIVPDSDSQAPVWTELNQTYAQQWPNITHRGKPPTDADECKGAAAKLKRFFSPKPGSGG